MKPSRFTDERIFAILKEQEAAAKTTEVCPRSGTSDATFWIWKIKYDGVEVSRAWRLRPLGEENARLKKLLAKTMIRRSGRTSRQKGGDAHHSRGRG